MKYPFKDKDVERVFATFPELIREKMLSIRDLILEEGENNPNIDKVIENLKWGQPSYATNPKVGSPIRLGIEKKTPNRFGFYVHCATSLIEDYKHIFADDFTYSGNRAVLFKADDNLPEQKLRHIINITLTYHLR